jgi:ribosomal protein S6
LPKERDRAWGYGVKELSEELQKNSDAHYIIDESRTKNLYINIAFFMKYPPSDFQKANISKVSGGYYHTLDFDPYYKFANLETRKINWQEDIYRKQILVGDEYAVSEKQASEHFLTKVFEIKDYFEVIIFRGYETNPVLKCKSDPKNYHCKSILEGSAK